LLPAPEVRWSPDYRLKDTNMSTGQLIGLIVAIIIVIAIIVLVVRMGRKRKVERDRVKATELRLP